MLHSLSDLRIIKTSINEIIRGIGVSNLKIRLGQDKDQILVFEAKLKDFSDELTSHDSLEIAWSCEEFQLIKFLLCVLLQELDHFEFHTRTGFTENEVFVLLGRIRENSDVVCYRS